LSDSAGHRDHLGKLLFSQVERRNVTKPAGPESFSVEQNGMHVGVRQAVLD
jgi:hypothetical protein